MPKRKLTTREKCEHYLTRMTVKHGGEVQRSFSTQSTYFEINGRKLRLSDHLATSADNEHGMLSIVLPSNDSDRFIIQCHGNGKMSIVNYGQLKEMVRTFSEIPMALSKCFINGHKEKDLEDPPKTDGLNVLGIPANVFTQGQMKLIKGITRKAATDNGYKFKL